MRVLTPVRSVMILTALTAAGAVGLEAGPTDAFASRHNCHAPHATEAAKLTYGTVHFANSCAPAAQDSLNLAIAKLDSFEAEPTDFAAPLKHDAHCAIAWWGAAMAARGNPLGGMLEAKEIAQGKAYVARAEAPPGNATPREKGLIEAMATYYGSYPDNITRARAYAAKMDALHAAYPADADIAAFDGLAIIEGVDLNDKTYARQRRAGAILEQVMKAHPETPGAPHFLIHAYDYPPLAPMAEHAAEIYPTLATASSHAQHMPSHIWSMLGAWDKSIAANRQSEFVADPTSAHDAVKGDIVFEHAFDFITYARLQKGEDRHVAQDLAAYRSSGQSMPLVDVARYALERGDWRDAARVPVTDDVFDAVLARFTRAYGAARAGDVKQAETELAALKALRGPIAQAAGEYWAQSDDIYADAAQAWILKAKGKPDDALALMRKAAIADDGHGKHIYLENKLLPMRESLADMELATGHEKEALADDETSLKLAPNRYRSFLGAAEAAAAIGDKANARTYFDRLLHLARDGDTPRPGESEARAFLAANG